MRNHPMAHPQAIVEPPPERARRLARYTSPHPLRQHPNMNALDHPDGRGIWIPRWILDVIPDDLGAGVLLAQLLWWHQLAHGTQRPRAHYHRDGAWWLLRADDEWHAECGLSLKQVRRIRKALLDLDLIVTARFKNRAGAPTTAWRPNYPILDDRRAKCANLELPSEGHFLFL